MNSNRQNTAERSVDLTTKLTQILTPYVNGLVLADAVDEVLRAVRCGDYPDKFEAYMCKACFAQILDEFGPCTHCGAPDDYVRPTAPKARGTSDEGQRTPQ